ncbi:MAG: hypothetical protein Q9170_006048 [Blastenia crenularia]
MPRLYRILGQPEEAITRWARKVFTRLEWPYLWQEFHKRSAQRDPLEKIKPQLQIPKIESTIARERNLSYSSWPTETSHTLSCEAQSEVKARQGNETISKVLLGETPDNALSDATPSSLATPALPIELLAQYLAGRWAAKEATIKAHHFRKLCMNDISILLPQSSDMEPAETRTNRHKLHALVAPEPTTMIAMDANVAKARGLYEATTRFPHIYGDVIGGHFFTIPVSDDQTKPSKPAGRTFWVRRNRIPEEDQQIAEISISHDNSHAVAVCMALDDKTEVRDPIKYIVDDGSGEPIHEPEWGDEGWLNI